MRAVIAAMALALATAACAPAPQLVQDVRPGAFCTPTGAQGVTTGGELMICSPTGGSPQSRWHLP